MKHLSWKYLAGLIDGEGCIDMQTHFDKSSNMLYVRPRLRITLSGKAGEIMIPALKESYGGYYHKRPRVFDKPEWQDAHTWEATGKTAIRPVLQNVVNHLIIKKEQAKLALWWLDHVGGKAVSQEARRAAVDEMKASKCDPQRLSERAEKILAAMITEKPWSSYSDKCLGCGATAEKHNSRGYCKKCYQAEYCKGNFSDATVQEELAQVTA